MEPQHVAIEEAALFLGVSSRTVYSYLRKGVLRPLRRGRKMGVDGEDLAVLHAARSNPDPQPVMRDELEQLQVEVITLRHRLDVALQLLGLHQPGLEMQPYEVALLYENAEQAAQKGWKRGEERAWADCLRRLRFDDLLTLESLKQDTQPWRWFLKLVSTLLLVAKDPGLKEELGEAKKHLLRLAELWLEVKGVPPVKRRVTVRSTAQPSKRLARKMARSSTRV